MVDNVREARVPLDIEASNLGVERGGEEVDRNPPMDGTQAESNEGEHASIVDNDLEGFDALVKGFEFFDVDGHVT